LARAADARELEDLLRVDAHLEEGVDDALGDCVVAAAGAEGGLTAAIRLDLQPDAILFGFHHSLVPSCLPGSECRRSAIARRSAGRCSAARSARASSRPAADRS